MRLADLYLGQIVRFHPVIGRKHDGKRYQIRALGAMYDGGPAVAWLIGKSGAIALEALSVDQRELPLLFPSLCRLGPGRPLWNMRAPKVKTQRPAYHSKPETRNPKPMNLSNITDDQLQMEMLMRAVRRGQLVLRIARETVLALEITQSNRLDELTKLQTAAVLARHDREFTEPPQTPQ